jgi:hypothetical protein
VNGWDETSSELLRLNWLLEGGELPYSHACEDGYPKPEPQPKPEEKPDVQTDLR